MIEYSIITSILVIEILNYFLLISRKVIKHKLQIITITRHHHVQLKDKNYCRES
jgi:hypothetical protein